MTLRTTTPRQHHRPVRSRDLFRRALAVGVGLIGIIGAAPATRAEVRIEHPFETDMLLQRDAPVPLWGRAAAGETVTVALGDASAETHAGNDGQWQIKLPPMKASSGRPLTIRGASNQVTLDNVAVGDLWFCSGQSNMTLDVGAAMNPKEEVAAANYPDIRFLDHIGWKSCSPKTAAGCSAVGYYFVRTIHKEVGVPVGLICRAQSMSDIQPWIPVEHLHLVPELQQEYDRSATRYLLYVGDWLDRNKKAYAEGRPIERVGESDVTRTGSLFESHVRGFTKMPVRGILWYQGESNVRDGAFYATRMKGLVAAWREAWRAPDLPFYFVQIAPFDSEHDLPALWEAQLAAARAIPGVEMSHSNDVGYSIHPPNKQLTGFRLAQIALAKTYGRTGITYAGPRFKSHAVEGSRVRIHFEFVGSGLVSRDGKPLGFFEVASADSTYVPAEARIDGPSVVVWSDAVKNPQDVRFAWKRDAVHNLSNKEGMPAYPFRMR